MMSVVSLKLVGTMFAVSLVLQLDLPLSNCYGVAAAKQVGCIDKERHALLELKAGLVAGDTNLLPSWESYNRKSDCCEWKGVTCGKQTGHVEMLDLNGFQFGPFGGEISASLMELPHLEHLDLSSNRFQYNRIPEFFGSLTNLRYLDLRRSQFGGRIPNDLGSLLHLKYLDLSSNGLVGTIPHQLGNLSHLQYLDLSWNALAGSVPYHQLGSLSNLQVLNLGVNQGLKLHDKNDHAGGEWLSNLTLLTHLDLSVVHNLNYSHGWLQRIAMLPKIEKLSLFDCDLSDLYFHSLSPSILNFSTTLTLLDLSSNTFSSSIIFQWVFNSTSNLTDLDLSFNLLEGPSIPYDFGNIRNHLERLDLSGNKLQGGILESFRDMCTLHSLGLDDNSLNEDVSTILLNLSGCARYSLQDLRLGDNQITGTLPDLSIFPSLKAIDLSNNLLSGKVPNGDEMPSKLQYLIIGSNSLEGGIPKSFGNLCSLSNLDMSNNSLGEDLSVIIHSLSIGCAKNSLQELILARNKITGTILDMSMFSSLRTVDLSDNLINGKIPKNYRFPYQLESLHLESNNLEGVISDSHFENMSMLKYVDLSYNLLTLIFSESWAPPFQLFSIYLRSCILGPRFPKWLQSQKYLQELDISGARISDIVPVWFWAQTSKLELMNISYNNLTGTIPNLPIRLSRSCQVILASNQFEGSIPPFLRSPASLDLSKNKFSEAGELLCTNTTVDLLALDISKNQLSKQLPDCWSHFKALVFLDLSDNALTGKVASSMGSLLELKVLILRNNSLSGKLPFSLKNCTKLVMLDLGENRFSGPIPTWIGVTGQQLQMLSLRRNQFFGSLPQNLCYLKNIQLLDLSVNNISGQTFKCLKNFSAMSQTGFSSTNIGSHQYYLQLDAWSFYIIQDYDLVALLMWKGAEQLFKNNKLILRSIDLSSNQLTGEIPEEIGDLVGLVSLNLSRNNLSGEITSRIGRLTSLEFLDLSRNHIFGSIPHSLAHIDRLSMLNLSNNNLSGRIPIGTQLQSFDTSSYEGNIGLCGKPLDKKCPGDEEETQEPKTPQENSPKDKSPVYYKNPTYWSVALGFITGFWGLWGSLLLSRTWRRAYVLFLNNITDTVYVFTVVNAAKFQRWLKG